jgi:hypothetical protein
MPAVSRVSNRDHIAWAANKQLPDGARGGSDSLGPLACRIINDRAAAELRALGRLGLIQK